MKFLADYINLADGVSAYSYYEITQEEYERILKEKEMKARQV